MSSLPILTRTLDYANLPGDFNAEATENAEVTEGAVTQYVPLWREIPPRGLGRFQRRGHPSTSLRTGREGRGHPSSCRCGIRTGRGRGEETGPVKVSDHRLK